jgi:uncharacterized protein YqiB (DUF1249 family)
MDLSRLKERMIVKNYKDMCKLLGEEIKTGKSKQYQLKEWKRYLYSTYRIFIIKLHITTKRI